MTRLLATMQCDVRLQFRNGFHYAVLFVLFCWGIVLTQLPRIDWEWLLPPLLFGNLSMVSFYFIGGLVLLEKGEGTLEAQVVTPLRNGEYLASKVGTLTLLSLFESLVIVVCCVGLGFRVAPMVAGIVLAALLYALAGFIAVSRYAAINEFIFPSAFYVAALSIPLLPYFDLWRSPLVYLHPLYGPLRLMQAAFETLSGWEWLYGLLYPALWIWVAAWGSRRAFERFIVGRKGGS